MSFLIGQTVGDYSILEELGSGGAGRVYRVEHTITRRHEALKVLTSERPKSAEQIERFVREIRLQASLNHPNIAAVLTAFSLEDEIALVCELLEGESLQSMIERGPLPVPRALDIMSQVLSALSYAHAHGVVHRDVSPANILLTAGGQTVKIIDFGLAKAAADLRLTQEGAAVGTPHYMSPEQIRGARALDARSDVYACGAVLYEMVTGRKPFVRGNAFEIMLGHAEEPLTPPRSIDPSLPRALDTIIVRAMGKKPEERFQSADSFRQALEGIRTEIKQPERGLVANSHQHPRRGLLWLIAILLIVSASGVAIYRTSHHRKAPSSSALESSTPAPAQEQLVIGSARSTAADPPAAPLAKPAPVATREDATVPKDSAKEPAAAPRAAGKFGSAIKHLNPFRRKATQPAADEPR